MIHSGLVEPDALLMGSLDAHLEWNKPHDNISALEMLFKQLNINALIFSPPAEPYRSIIDDIFGDRA